MEIDQRALLLAFNEQFVRYILVGAYALNIYTEPRATKDLDVFVDTSDENAQKVFAALARFGAPISGMTPADFQDPYSGFQFGVAPSQIDVILAISAISFEEAWEESIAGQTGDGIPVRYLSRDHLIRNKLDAGRLQDLADVEALINARKAYSTPEEQEMMNDRQNIAGTSPYEPIIGFSRAVRIGNVVHVSGTGPVGAEDLSPAEQTRAVLALIEKALSQAGATFPDVVRTRMFLAHAEDWEEIGRAHGEVFGTIRPASTMVVAALLNPKWRVEIEAEAVLTD